MEFVTAEEEAAHFKELAASTEEELQLVQQSFDEFQESSQVHTLVLARSALLLR
jgi:hypothetical protein